MGEAVSDEAVKSGGVQRSSAAPTPGRETDTSAPRAQLPPTPGGVPDDARLEAHRIVKDLEACLVVDVVGHASVHRFDAQPARRSDRHPPMVRRHRTERSPPCSCSYRVLDTGEERDGRERPNGGSTAAHRWCTRAPATASPVGVRLPLDDDLSPRLADALTKEGWDVVHVSSLGLRPRATASSSGPPATTAKSGSSLLESSQVRAG
jgi:hypothetical protein